VIETPDSIHGFGNILHNYGKLSQLLVQLFILRLMEKLKNQTRLPKGFKEHFKKYQRGWDTLLAIPEFGYNSHCHQSIGMSPFEADLGYIPRMPLGK
jgi:hypothetical protein